MAIVMAQMPKPSRICNSLLAWNNKKMEIEAIDKTKAQCFFYGAAQGNPRSGGFVGVLYLFENHWYKLVVGTRLATANKAKLMDLRLVLKLSISKWVQHIQFFGDSLMVINWFKKKRGPKNIYLKMLYDDTCRLLGCIEHTTFHHIYRDHNVLQTEFQRRGC